MGENERGNYDTVRIMAGVARSRAGDPRVRQLALAILLDRNVGSHNFLDEDCAIAEFVQKNVRYVRDPNGIEQLHDPVYMIDHIRAGDAQGDCDDQALLLASLLLSIGAQPYFVIVRYNRTSGSFNHIYTCVYDKNWTDRQKSRLVMDTIVKTEPIGFEVPYASIQEIAI